MGEVRIVDYGASNLLSLYRSVAKVGGRPTIISHPGEMKGADRVIVPGVGAYRSCSDAFRSLGWDEALADYLRHQRPLLGVCVGMQLMFDFSLEFGRHTGLGLVSGHVGLIPKSSGGVERSVPHVGWSPLHYPIGRENWRGTILENLEVGSDSVYFVHSFECLPENYEHKLAVVDYNGHEICAAVLQDNISGVQFHPEKSGQVGLGILERFIF